MYLVFLSLVLACRESTHRFSALGQTTVDPDQVIPPTSGNSDTGGVDDDETNADAPVITEAYAFHDELPQIGPVIEMHILYTDTQDDVEGGVVNVSYFSESQNSSVEANIDGVDSIHEDGEITLVFQDVEPNEAYTFTVSVVDTNENASESVEVYANPTAE